MLKFIIMFTALVLGYGTILKNEYVYQNKLGKYQHFNVQNPIPAFLVLLLSIYKTVHFFLALFLVAVSGALMHYGFITSYAFLISAFLAGIITWQVNRKRNPNPAMQYKV